MVAKLVGDETAMVLQTLRGGVEASSCFFPEVLWSLVTGSSDQDTR
jgi:hypothetical protein